MGSIPAGDGIKKRNVLTEDVGSFPLFIIIKKLYEYIIISYAYINLNIGKYKILIYN